MKWQLMMQGIMFLWQNREEIKETIDEEIIPTVKKINKKHDLDLRARYEAVVERVPKLKRARGLIEKLMDRVD